MSDENKFAIANSSPEFSKVAPWPDLPNAGEPAAASDTGRVRERGRTHALASRIATGAVCLLVLAFMALAPVRASASFAFAVSVGYAPPPLPVYVQPVCPGPGYIWTPGYWAYDPGYGYYWVPGTWVVAPFVGALWTPGYWGWRNSAYVWFDGYWGPEVGFYGGVPYGFGYTGFGYFGGYWNHGQFYYNRSVNNVTNITTVYNRTVINNTRIRNISYNGGPGGVDARPTAAQLAAARQRRDPPTSVQRQHQQAARGDPALRAAANHGRPPIAATQRPGVMRGPHVVRASRAGGPYRAPADRGAARAARPATHGRTSAQRTTARPPHNTGATARTQARNRPAPQQRSGARSQARNRTVAPQRNPARARNTRTPAYRGSRQPQSVPHVPAKYRTAPRSERAPQAAPHNRPAPPPRVNRTAPRYRSAPRAQRAPRASQYRRGQPAARAPRGRPAPSRSNGNRAQQGHHPPQ
jgi:WXXGXW repeat (2 copies)